MEGQYCLTPNTDYYILVSGSNFEAITGSTKEGYFGLTLRDNGPYPVNNLICEAKTVTVQTQYTYNNATLATETNIKGTYCFEPNPNWTWTGQDNDHAVWYYIGPVTGRTMVVDANSTTNDIDLQMALYSSATPKGACVTPTSSPTLTEVQKEYAGAGVV